MYNKCQLSVANPGLILILIDQSGSMEEEYSGNRSKAEFAALAINRCVYEIIAACTVGEKIKDRCHVIIIGYGNDTAKMIVGDTVSELHKKPKRKDPIMQKVSDGAGGLIEVAMSMPVWLDPAAAGGTPMAEAFREARGLCELWIQEHLNNFPPVVINVTDGAPSDGAAAEAEARALLNLRTTDGQLILLNAHIGASGGPQIILPNSEPADPYARFLYQLSSELPQPMAKAAINAGLNVAPQARGCIFNANAETLVKLLTFGSNSAR